MAAIDGLKRVRKVYGLLERLRSGELGLAAARVGEVTRAGEAARTARELSNASGRAALLLGDSQRWLMAEAERQVGEVLGKRLEVARVELESIRQAAVREYRASHLQRSQVESVIEANTQNEEAELTRRTQAAADDRYLSRRAWMQDQDEARRRMITG